MCGGRGNAHFHTCIYIYISLYIHIYTSVYVYLYMRPGPETNVTIDTWKRSDQLNLQKCTPYLTRPRVPPPTHPNAWGMDSGGVALL